MNIVYHCKGCRENIDPDGFAVHLILETPVRDGGSIDPTGFAREDAYSHVKDAGYYKALGYREVERGILREMVDRRRPGA